MSNPLVSIVIPAYNSEGTIRQTITAILEQDCPNPLEIIVVDDGSTDKTGEVVNFFVKNNFHLYQKDKSPVIAVSEWKDEVRTVDKFKESVNSFNKKVFYLYQKNSGPATARNRGAKEAKGEFVFFTDADCIPHPDWIRRMIAHFNSQKKNKTAVVSGSYGISNPNDILAQCIHKEIVYRHHNLMPESPKVFGSYNFGIRKKVFDQVGGFNSEYRHASGEDNDLSYKLLQSGYEIYFERNAIVDHYHTAHLLKYLCEQYRHGFWRVKMYRRHPQMGKGDDYTFWKDIVEIPMVIAFFGFLTLSLFDFPSARVFPFGILITLLFLEFYFAKIITKSLQQSLFFAFVMFARSFARTFGFIFGLCNIPASSPR